MRGKASGKDLEKLLQSGVLKKGGALESKKAPKSKEFIEGNRISAPSGETFLHREVFPPGYLHGNVVAGSLSSLPCEPLEKLCGEAPEISGVAFLDIETTGLSSACKAFLVGVGRYLPGEGFVVAQYFMENPASEICLLEAIAEEACKSSLVVTYNGACFDLPILEERARAREIAPLFRGIPHLDLLHFARSAWKCDSKNCRLITMEEDLLDFWREGDIPGREIPGVYREYILRGRSERMKTVFYHNALDILSLACLFLKASTAKECDSRSPLELFLHHNSNKRKTGTKKVCRASKTPPKEDGIRSLKELFKAQKEEGDLGGMENTCEKLISREPRDPRWVLELMRLRECGEGDLEGALRIADRALEKGLWHPKDRKKLEDRRAKILEKISLVGRD
ncbi:hypothetical protein EPN96_02285 [bacterium]|nr:MAG: hypothetical protein EPN96_02285 [bacterium]